MSVGAVVLQVRTGHFLSTVPAVMRTSKKWNHGFDTSRLFR